MSRYNIVRCYESSDVPNRIIRRNVTLDEAEAHCRNPETSSRTATSSAARKRTSRLGRWFDGYVDA